MTRMGRSVTLALVVFALVFLGWANYDLPSWQDVQAEQFCLSVPEGWYDCTTIARADLLENEQGLTLTGCWSDAPFPDDDINEITALLLLLVEEEAWSEELRTLEDEATLRDRWEGPVAGEPGSWSVYDLVDPDLTFWVVYQETPRSDGLHLVLVVGGPRPASVSDPVIRCMLESVRLCSVSHAPCTITVLPGESIQAAIDAAPGGAVICLSPGEWRENLVIEKSLTLRAAKIEPEPLAVIRSARQHWPVIRIESEDPIQVTLQGLRITGAFGFCYPTEPERICPVGISVRGSATAAIANNTITDNQGDGVWLRGFSQATITVNTICDNNWSGIEMRDSSQATIEGNTICDNEVGMWMRDFSQATIRVNTILSNKGPGIRTGGSSQATVEANTIRDNKSCGIWLEGSSQGTIGGNTVRDNWSGIRMRDSSEATINGNTIRDNEVGIWLWGSSRATITGNVIRDNESYGAALFERPCSDLDQMFTGRITGSGNTGGDNPDGQTCPDDLAFLFTEEGGELDRREE